MKHARRLPRLPLMDWMAIVVLSLVTLLFTWVFISSPTEMIAGQIVAHVYTSEKVVALTFDDGPLPVHTEETLQILARENVRATFFVIGKEAALHPTELQAIVNAGHTVGNHSYTHKMMAFMPASQIAWEIEKTDAVIRAAGYTGEIPFRVPYNLKFVSLPLYLASNNRPDISRDVLTQEDTTRSAANVTLDIVRQVQPGSIILMHPMYNHTATTRQALPQIIEQLQAKGYRFVTIPELLTYQETI